MKMKFWFKEGFDQTPRTPSECGIMFKYLDREVNLDEMRHFVASDQGLYRLPLSNS